MQHRDIAAQHDPAHTSFRAEQKASKARSTMSHSAFLHDLQDLDDVLFYMIRCLWTGQEVQK